MPLETPSLSVSLENDKYQVIQNADGRVFARRYGEAWRDCCGDKLVLSLAQEVDRLRKYVAVVEENNTKGQDRYIQLREAYDLALNEIKELKA